MPKKVRKTQGHATPQEVWDLLRELTKSQKETNRQLTESKLEVDRQLKELAISINKADGNFNNKWGAFVERLIAGDLVSLLEERGIPVTQITARKVLYREDKSELGEYDMVAYNGDSIVVTEAKTTLTKAKVDKFLKKINIYKKKHLIDSDKTVFGAIGFLEAEEGVLDYAEEMGLFIIRSPEGKSGISKIINSPGFKPKEF